jgi:hypothetical protein
MKDMKYTILIVTGLGTRRDVAELLVTAFESAQKGDSKDWDNPILKIG